MKSGWKTITLEELTGKSVSTEESTDSQWKTVTLEELYNSPASDEKPTETPPTKDAVPVAPAKKEEPASGTITMDELIKIAKDNKLSYKQALTLADNAQFLGVQVEGTKRDLGQEAKGFVSEAIGFGIPQKEFVEAGATEDEKNARDVIWQLAQNRKSWKRQGAEIAAGFIAPGGSVATAAKLGKLARIARTAAISGAQGAAAFGAAAKRGEEMQEALKGAAIAGTLGGLSQKAADIIGDKMSSRAAGKALDKINKKSDVPPEDLKETAEAVSDYIGKKIDEKHVNGINHAVEQAENLPSINKKLDDLAERTQDKDAVIQDIVLGNSELGPETIERYQRASKTSLEAKTVHKIIQQEIKDFEKYAGKSVKNLTAEGREFKKEKLRQFFRLKHTDEAMTPTTLGKRVGERLKGFESKLMHFSDNYPVFRTIDSELGTDLTIASEKASARINQESIDRKYFTEILDTAKKNKRTNKIDNAKLHRALTTGNEGGQVPDEVYKYYDTIRNQLRQKDIDEGLEYAVEPNYIPKVMKHPRDVMLVMENKYKELVEELGPLENYTLEELGQQEEAYDFLRGLALFNNNKVPEPSQIKEMLGPSMVSRIRRNQDAAAFFVKERTGKDIPEFLLETDVDKIFARRIHAAEKMHGLRDFISQLDYTMAIADKKGEHLIVKWLGNLRSDLLGARRRSEGKKGMLEGAMGAETTSEIANTINLTAKRLANQYPEKSLGRFVLEVAGETPAMLSSIGREFYRATMGLNPKNVIESIFSPAILGASEMGPDAIKYYLKSLKKISEIKSKGMEITLSPALARSKGMKPGDKITSNSLEEIMANKGLIQPDWKGELLDPENTAEGLEQLKEMFGVAEHALNKILLGPFTAAERVARASSFFMGQEITKDMLKSPRFAQKYITGLNSPAHKRAMQEALELGDTEALEKHVTRHLNANVLFNYDRVNMSEYGRTMGPIFSVLTKFPTSMWGKVLSDVMREKKNEPTWAAKVATFLGPTAALWAVDNGLAALDEKYDPTKNEFARKIIGYRGLTGMTAGGSLTNPMEAILPEGEATRAQMITGGTASIARYAQAKSKHLLGQISDEELERTEAALSKTVGNIFSVSLPAASSLLRIMGEDIPIYEATASGYKRPRTEGNKIMRRVEEIKRMGRRADYLLTKDKEEKDGSSK